MILPSLPPSDWVLNHLREIPHGGRVLDLACGHGRHARALAQAGFDVLAVDRDGEALMSLAACPGVTTQPMELEAADWPLAGESFDGIVVTNYLWRQRLADVLALLAPGGVLIYETFMVGNAEFGKPSNPAFLLQPGELRAVATEAGLSVIAFQEGFRHQPKPAMVQAIVARREIGGD